MAPSEEPQLQVRPATATDLGAVAEVFLATRAAAVPQMPQLVHSATEVRDFVASWDLGQRRVWVAEEAGLIVGFVGLTGNWLEDLYVLPDRAGTGVGSALLDVAKALVPDGFCLWVFAANEPARRFYRDRGLIELDHTDGTGNEEQTPDVRMAWPGRDPLVFFRGLIDQADAELGPLLAQRMALTQAVQPFKAVPGHAGRDLNREHQIAASMAARTGLPVARLEPVVHAVINEALTLFERAEHPH